MLYPVLASITRTGPFCYIHEMVYCRHFEVCQFGHAHGSECNVDIVDAVCPYSGHRHVPIHYSCCHGRDSQVYNSFIYYPLPGV